MPDTLPPGAPQDVGMTSPVLFIVFNRPEPTARVFEAIRAARPPRLYIAADGPRPDKPDEARKCAQVREICAAIDWDCEAHVLYRDTNQGCRLAVSSAIAWFFAQEEEGIVLEDDCLPSGSFFVFCDAMLERYRDDECVAQIAGSNFIGPAPDGASYVFTRYPDIWGWATWRRSWAHYDIAMREWSAEGIASLPAGSPLDGYPARRYWQTVFDEAASGAVDTWDYQWVFSCWRRGCVTIVPSVNLIENIGFGGDATHTTRAPPSFLKPRGELPFPLVHPRQVAALRETDRLIGRIRYQSTWPRTGLTMLRQIPLVAAAIRGIRSLRRGAGGAAAL